MTLALGLWGALGCAPTPTPPELSPPRCVWAAGTDSKLVGAYLKAWTRQNGLGELQGWGVSMQPHRARITLRTEHGSGVYYLVPGESCKAVPQVDTARAQRSKPIPPATLNLLAKGFPAARRQLAGGQAPQRCRPQDRGCTIGACDQESWGFLGLAVLLVLLAWFAEAAPKRVQRGALVLTTLGVGALVAYSVAPLFTMPFSNDAPLLRAAYARESVFADWNHSYLPYLLNRPTTWFSMEPWALRIMPFGWLLAETALLVVVARRQGGLVAGALAGVWFASEVRRRQGIVELTDWDLAGLFLLGLVWWCTRPKTDPATSTRLWIWLVVLMTAAFLGSYMMLVPVTALVGLLWLDPETRARLAPPTTVIWALIALSAVRIFVAGQSISPAVSSLDELVRLMVVETPFHRTLWMIPPFVIGVGWLAWGWRRLDRRFIAAGIVSIPLATLFAWRFSHVNQGYYICLTTPLVLLASAAGVGAGAERLCAWATPRMGALASRIVIALGLTGLALFTVSLWSHGDLNKFAPSGLRNMAPFEKLIAGDRLPIVTDTEHFSLYLGYERARRGESPRAPLLSTGPPDIAARTRFLNPRTCRVAGGWESLREFYLVREGNQSDKRLCPPPAGYGCKPLFKRRVWLNYFRCSRGASR